MLNVSAGRFIWTVFVGYFFCSMLNWGIAEFLLNDWAAPYFEGFVRSGEGASAGINIVKMSVGFMIPLFVSAWWFSTIRTPISWVLRAIYVGSMVSLAAFFGTYTFISGWGNVNWWPLMVTAVCDMGSIVPGTLLIAWLQTRGTQTIA
jgi:hypothetical protein